jgi:predicted AlkP superfamily phosphohydrolase/phosphomutase
VGERLLFIGWDGADWEILDDLIARGCLPNVASMIEQGARGTLTSTIPSHSWAAWATFLTGLHPAGHGVYDFVERHPMDPGRRIPVTSRSIKAETFLERLSGAGREVRSANVPVTYPPLRVNGRMIGGVAIPKGASFVHPKEWETELERRAPFPVNGMEWARFQSDPDGLVDEVERLVGQRTASYEVLLEGEWSVGVCVYVAPDRLQHALAAYLLPSHPSYPRLADTPLGERIRSVFVRLDADIERLVEAAGGMGATTTVLMSDHGFRPITRQSNLNRLLAHLGFSSRSRTADATTALRRSGVARAVAGTRLGHALKRRLRAPNTLDWSRTVAYQSIAGGGVSLNLEGREPEGEVKPSDYDRVRVEIREALLSYRDPETGQAPVGRVLLREQLPQGPYIDLAPDLLVTAAPLWSFTQADELASPTEWPSGNHRIDGILAATGGRTVRGDLGRRHIADLAPTALAFCGVPVPAGDGRAIEPIAGAPVVREHPGPETDGMAGLDRLREGVGMSDEENEYVAQHLRDLGYIE